MGIQTSTHLVIGRSLLWSALCLGFSCSIGVDGAKCTAEPPAIPREFRAAWVATVANIDWPTKAGLQVEKQKAEMVGLLDVAASLRLNAIVLQVRPAADAMYDSELEPWSEYLSGEMGKSPTPHYDPLAFAIEEAHARGIEVHAWFNPYRARHKSSKTPASADHVSRTHPELIREYGGYQWLDPGESEGVEHTLAVIVDVVKRYDVDGVHLDDYFYPYPVNDEEGKKIPFPDDASWEKRPASQQDLSRDGWRRNNVDQLIEQIYSRVKKEKRWVKVGISPFGIWRPGFPESIKGFDAYAELYADARRWQQEGWVDYLTPQLYWKIDSKGQSYPKLLQWWHEQNTKGRHLWPGNYASRLGAEGDGRWDKTELMDQIALTREHVGATGNVHFSMKTFTLDYGDVNNSLTKLYAEPALVPACPWLGDEKPDPPAIRMLEAKNDQERQEGHMFVVADDHNPAPQWVIQTKVGDEWTVGIVPAPTTANVFVLKPDVSQAFVTAISRTGIASAAIPIPVE